jgi:YHS domain-containing protein
MIRWVLQLLLLLIVIRLVWRFIAGVMDGMTPRPQESSRKKSVPLAKDPVCGVYVDPRRALTLDAGKQTQYFCSETCRDEYTRGVRALAK